MQQRIIHGATVDFVTPDEIARILPQPPQRTRIRVPGTVQLDATGAGRDDLYKVPVGYGFELRRVVLTLTGNIQADPNTGNVLLNAAGKFVAYLRSGSLIEYGQPQYGAAVQVPGVQHWGSEEGPYLRNGEVLQVQAAGLTANVVLGIYAEGILERPGYGEGNGHGA